MTSDAASDRPQQPSSSEGRRATVHGFTALASGTKLERYTIEHVIAAGGFGITYVARHESLQRIFALKEHFPRQFAYRDGNTSEVRPSDPKVYIWALERFLQEGRSLARCKHPHVVDVTDVFEANGTAYMVLGFEDGESFSNWLKSRTHAPSQAEMDAILAPLLDALICVHEQEILHRDIAPDNIIIRRNGSPCLIDFGAARHAIAQRSQVLSAIVKTGYSPPEQYTTTGKAQGPWSDIYALGATLYRAVTGTVPQEATERVTKDELMAVSAKVVAAGAYRPGFLAGIDAALRLKPGDRPQTVREWRDILFDAPATTVAATRPVAASAPASPVAQAMPRAARRLGRPALWIGGTLIGLGLMAMATNAIGLWRIPGQGAARPGSSPAVAQATMPNKALNSGTTVPAPAPAPVSVPVASPAPAPAVSPPAVPAPAASMPATASPTATGSPETAGLQDAVGQQRPQEPNQPPSGEKPRTDDAARSTAVKQAAAEQAAVRARDEAGRQRLDEEAAAKQDQQTEIAAAAKQREADTERSRQAAEAAARIESDRRRMAAIDDGPSHAPSPAPQPTVPTTSTPVSSRVLFGAIALSPSSRAIGWATDKGTRTEAAQVALGWCSRRAPDCRIVTRFRDGCGALALGADTGWGASERNLSRAIAEDSALRLCGLHSRSCRIVRSVCNTPLTPEAAACLQQAGSLRLSGDAFFTFHADCVARLSKK